jgi:CubicO group peptidase (beta-lactamase class C family)
MGALPAGRGFQRYHAHMRVLVVLLTLTCASSAQQGFDAQKLDRWRKQLEARGTKALLVQRAGRTVFEWYSPDHGPDKRHYSASLAKALVGGVSLMLAIQDGRIQPTDPASKYIPAWRNDPLKSRILIRHLATHTSGIEDAEQDNIPHMEIPGWKGRFWRREPDPFTPTVHEAPVLFEPGSRWAYSNPGMAALAYAVTASLRGAPQSDIRSLLKARVFDPLGIPEAEWSIGYGRAYEVDGLSLYGNWGGGAFTARAAAKAGAWMMERGAMAVRDQGLPISADAHAPASGLGWYTNARGAWPALPPDAFAGAGAGHQVLLAIPSLQLVVVRNGANLEPNLTDGRYWGAVYDHIFAPLMQTLADPPYPPSQVIQGVRFDPPAAIRRAADGSDNWPVTWGADGHIYTSYGDGWGFDPRVEKKLSQGWARIEGGPEEFRGINIRSESGERTGDGRAGAKASGLIMVDGVLYSWIRNTGNAQLAWSEDLGQTWHWGFRFTTSMGSPAFLNFGRNNEGARDGFVYAYSQDGPSAYTQDDGIVLARAPKSRLREQSAWEFWAGDGRWSANIADRVPVFRFEGHCERVDAVWHPGLRRYLLAVGYNHASGWGLFEAPEPWGPWSVAFHTHKWDLDETHGYRLPSKWIGADGRMHLIYSGRLREDAFCVRGLTLLLR